MSKRNIAVDLPIRSEMSWMFLWSLAAQVSEDDGGERMEHHDTALVLLLRQADARENGPWVVSRDGSHRRPSGIMLGAQFGSALVADKTSPWGSSLQPYVPTEAVCNDEG